MFGRPEMLADFYGTYKNGLLEKKKQVILYVYEKMIEGKGAIYYEGDYSEYDFAIHFEQVEEISEKIIEGEKMSSYLVFKYGAGYKQQA